MCLLNNKCSSVTHFRIVCSSCVCNFNEIDQYITPRNSAKNYKNVCTNPRWLPHGGSNYPKKNICIYLLCSFEHNSPLFTLQLSKLRKNKNRFQTLVLPLQYNISQHVHIVSVFQHCYPILRPIETTLKSYLLNSFRRGPC